MRKKKYEVMVKGKGRIQRSVFHLYIGWSVSCPYLYAFYVSYLCIRVSVLCLCLLDLLPVLTSFFFVPFPPLSRLYFISLDDVSTEAKTRGKGEKGEKRHKVMMISKSRKLKHETKNPKAEARRGRRYKAESWDTRQTLIQRQTRSEHWANMRDKVRETQDRH